MALPKRPADDSSDWRSYYQIENPAAVEAFIAEHIFLVPVLKHAPKAVAAHFGREAQLSLELVYDLEDDPPSGFLFLGIGTSLDPEKAYQLRDRLDDAWWTDAVRDAQGLVTVDLARR